MHKILLATCAICLSMAANAKNYVAALPANPSPATQEREGEFLGQVFQHLQPNDTLIVFDGTNLRRVATLQMPATIGEGKRARSKALGPDAGQAMEFIGSQDASHPVDTIDLPATLREIGNTILPGLPDHQANVMVLGSAFYNNPRNIKFDHRQTTLSDGFLTEKGGTFGLRGEESLLKGALVTICYTDKPDDFLSEPFRQSTVAFWGKSIAGRGARVGSIEAYNPGCAARLLSDAVDPKKYEINPSEKTYLTKQHWVPVEVR